MTRAMLGVGLASALGCGGKAESTELQPAFLAPAAVPPPGGPRRAPPSAPPQLRPPGMAPERQPMVTPAPAPVDSGPRYIGDTAEAAASNVLISNCGPCHGPAAPEEGSGGIRFIGDLEKLVAAGLIVPLSSATSRIAIVMTDGSMPPPSSGLPPATAADINIVTSYIDNPRFWPGVVPPAPPTAVADAGAAPPLPPAVVADAGVDVGVNIGAEPPAVDGAVDAGAVAD